MKSRRTPSYEELARMKVIWSYNPETGDITINDYPHAKRAGQVAGTVTRKGYIRVGMPLNRGVRRSSGVGFIARITNGYKTEYLGTFPTAKAAALAYELRAQELHGEFYKAPSYLKELSS